MRSASARVASSSTWAPPDVRRGDQRADARARVHVGDDAALLERPEHADVREPLQATAAEDERDAAVPGSFG